MKPQNQQPAKSRLLISEPALYDFYFKQSVVLLADHNDEGSFGLIINKPIALKFNDIVKEFPKFDAPVYLGGPVKTDNLFVLHKLGNKIDNSIEVMNGLYWGGDIEIIKEQISLGLARPDNIRFYLGFSSWSPGQLSNEMTEKSWVVMNAKIANVFETAPKHMWSELMKSFGREYAIWANFPADPIMN